MSPTDSMANEEKDNDDDVSRANESADATDHHHSTFPLSFHHNNTRSTLDPQEPRQVVGEEDEQGFRQAEEVVDGDDDKDEMESNGDDASDADSWDSEYDLWYGDGDGRPGRARAPPAPSTTRREEPVDEENVGDDDEEEDEDEDEDEDDDDDSTRCYLSCSSSDGEGASAATLSRHRSSIRRYNSTLSREPDDLAFYPGNRTPGVESRDRLYYIPYTGSYDSAYLPGKGSHETSTHKNPHDTTYTSPNDGLHNLPISSTSHRPDTPSIGPYDDTDDDHVDPHDGVHGFYDCTYSDLYGHIDGDMELDLDEWYQRVYFPDPQTLEPRVWRPKFMTSPSLSAALADAQHWHSRNNEQTLPNYLSRQDILQDTSIANLYEADDSNQGNAEGEWQYLSSVAHANGFYEYEKRATRRALSRGIYPLDEPLADQHASDREPDPEVWEDYFEALSEASLVDDMWSSDASVDMSTTGSDLVPELEGIRFLVPFTDQSPPPTDEDSESNSDDDFDPDYDSAEDYEPNLVPGESLIEFAS